jgi:hypothetical protein
MKISSTLRTSIMLLVYNIIDYLIQFHIGFLIM